MSEAGDLVRGGPELGRGEEVVLEFAQVGVEAVADLHLEQVAEAFDRVEFRAVGRQGQEAEVGGEPGVVLRQVAAGLVLMTTGRAAGSEAAICWRKSAWMSRSMAGVNNRSLAWAPSTSSPSCR